MQNWHGSPQIASGGFQNWFNKDDKIIQDKEEEGACANDAFESNKQVIN